MAQSFQQVYFSTKRVLQINRIQDPPDSQLVHDSRSDSGHEIYDWRMLSALNHWLVAQPTAFHANMPSVVFASRTGS